MVNEADVRLFADKCKAIFEQVGRDIIGQEDIVELTVIAMIAGGNVLLEGVPGIGKTRLIRSLGRVFSLPFSRIQFTPDLMPADITGTNVLEKDEKGNAVYTFRPGPIFSHIVLADEINRATPKSQSALLEAMQEHTVTVDGKDQEIDCLALVATDVSLIPVFEESQVYEADGKAAALVVSNNAEQLNKDSGELINGLYAAGPILSAAVDGEGVLSGNELTEAVMFGSTAGTEAAVYVSDNQ